MVTRGGAARRSICTASRPDKRLLGCRAQLDIGDAGWSSPVARQAHNLKVVGSNPTPATTDKNPATAGFFCAFRNRLANSRNTVRTITAQRGESVTMAPIPRAAQGHGVQARGRIVAREITNKSIDGITQLVLLVPIKPGVIDAYENITYESRLRFVAEALHRIRVNGREHELVTPFADVAERILTVFDFSIGVLDKNFNELKPADGQNGAGILEGNPQRYMLLVANFDGPFEPYMRLIWRPLGVFLDLLLCNCVGYPLSSETGFPEYIDWVRHNQVEPSIFYATSSNTLRDQIYLADLEKLQRELEPSPESDAKLAALTVRDPEKKALATWRTKDPRVLADSVRLSFEALNVLYSLAAYYPPDKPEGRILLRASNDLLSGLHLRVGEIVAGPPSQAQTMLSAFGVTGGLGPYTEHWRWLRSTASAPLPAPPVETVPDAGQVQRGLLTGYDQAEFQTTHGMTLLYSITCPVEAGPTLRDLPIGWSNDAPDRADLGGDAIRFYCNVAFTAPGLRAMRLDPVELAKFPKEFRDGLFVRAPLIGDQRENHPRRWQFPYRFDPDTARDDMLRPTIHSEEIDVVVQLRIERKHPGSADLSEFIDFETEALKLQAELSADKERALLKTFDTMARNSFQELLHPIDMIANSAEEASTTESINALTIILKKFDFATWFALAQIRGTLGQSEDSGMDSAPGMRLLAIESTFRPLGRYDAPLPEVQLSNRDHFGFIDGISQPEPALIGQLPSPGAYENRVPYGDILCGYPNGRGDSSTDQNWNQSDPLLKDGSFMVLRKIAMYPDRLDELRATNPELPNAMVGRTADGQPLLPGHTSGCNDFTYEHDPEQAHCPFSAHIRLANPRDTFQGRPAPRIVRRGMSYGTRYVPGNEESKKQPRGILFMAHAASLAEQYEVIQRWLNGGNSTGVSSAANDPLTGARQDAGPYTFRYRTAAGVQRAVIAKPVTELRWGLYAFTPSRSSLSLICLPKRPLSFADETAQGQAVIDRILALPDQQQRREWKRLLEDFFVKDLSDLGETPPVWRAIRSKKNKGVLRIKCGLPYGDGKVTHEITLAEDIKPVVLVADAALIKQVLTNSAVFSSSERLKRTHGSIGDHYVAMDPDPKDTDTTPVSTYAKESIKTNQVLFSVSNDQQDPVFTAAYQIAKARLDRAKEFSTALGNSVFFKIDLRRDFLVPVVGALCKALFDIPDATILDPSKGHIDLGPWGWQPVDTSGGTVAAPNTRKPRCPADFMAPSRFCFYPRPSPAIQNYGVTHGQGLKAASRKLIDDLRLLEKQTPGQGFKGLISAALAKAIPTDNDLLARNIVGSMTGAIPPLDGNLRGIFFDWINGNTLWQHQTEYLKAKAAFDKDPNPNKSHREYTEGTIKTAVQKAMCKRPAPDLLYRTATQNTKIGGVEVKDGETVILALISPMLASLDNDAPEIEHVFGGFRKDAWQKPGEPAHACPAYHMVMAIIYGVVAALFDSGRIVIQPASMILQVRDWGGPPPDHLKDTAPSEETVFTPFA
jgi:hypothetical protein